MTELTLTTPVLSDTVKRLLTEAADRIVILGHDLAQPAPHYMADFTLRFVADRIHGVRDLMTLHNEAAQPYLRLEAIADARAERERRRPTRTNTQDTDRAVERLYELSSAVVAAGRLVEMAKEAAVADAEAAIVAVGDVAGLTFGQVIDRMYAAAGVARSWV